MRDNLQPTDFADAHCRVTPWVDFQADYTDVEAYRIWICRCTHHWFQRHEWRRAGRNSTDLDEWIYSGYYPRKKFPEHATIDPKDLTEI